MGTLTRRTVSSLPQVSSALQSRFINSDITYDYAIAGVPFLSAADTQHPLVRMTAPYRRDQLDTSSNPGEQSLVGWWLRSQTSFHGGTGIVFEEPDPTDPTVQLRFADSAGVNVWTPGKVTLLKQANLITAAAGQCLLTAGTDGSGVDCWLQSDNNALKRVLLDGTTTSVTWGGANTIASLVNDGSNYYAADSVGIYQGTMAGGAGSKIWNTGNANVCVGWVKQRLVAGIGPAFYELVGGSPPTLPTAKYTHPNASWKWTAIAESPEAIYAAGYVGQQSAVYKFVLDNSGSVPTLTSGIITTSLPVGEIVTALFTYLGSFVAIGTNRGMRIASIDSNGDLSYGPLTVDFSKLASTPGQINAIAGRDRFIYFTMTNGINGGSGLGCLDLSTQVAFRRFAWATDLQTHVTGTIRGVGVVGASNQLVTVVDAAGSFLEHATNLEPSGYLTTGNIRYHQLEPKLFKFALTRAASPLAGGIGLSVIRSDGVVIGLATFTATGGNIADEVALPIQLGPQEFVALSFALTRDADPTKGPELHSYQLKALPGTKRQRIFSLPLLCFDFEADRNGAKTGTEGGAVSRIAVLEALEEAGDIVAFQDLSRHPMETRLVVIDDLKFVQTAPPKTASGWGGRVEVTLRSVD